MVEVADVVDVGVVEVDYDGVQAVSIVDVIDNVGGGEGSVLLVELRVFATEDIGVVGGVEVSVVVGAVVAKADCNGVLMVVMVVGIGDVVVVRDDVRLVEIVMVVVESVGIVVTVGADVVVCTGVVGVDCDNVWAVSIVVVDEGVRDAKGIVLLVELCVVAAWGVGIFTVVDVVVVVIVDVVGFGCDEVLVVLVVGVVGDVGVVEGDVRLVEVGMVVVEGVGVVVVVGDGVVVGVDVFEVGDVVNAGCDEVLLILMVAVSGDVGVVEGDVRLVEIVVVVVGGVGVVSVVGVNIAVCTDVVEVDCDNVWVVLIVIVSEGVRDVEGSVLLVGLYVVAVWGVGVVVLIGVVAVVVADVVGFDCGEVRTVSLVVVCDSARVDGSVELLVVDDV